MKAVYALYPDGQTAQQAVNRLRATGLADRDITILTAQPMEDYEFGHIDKKNYMWWIACAGGLIGNATGFGLSWLTETSWPMNVGGLPVWAWWPNLIIIFELTMLGAILATVGTLIVTAFIQDRGRKLYDPAVTEGKILVGVEDPREAIAVEQALRAVPGAVLKTV